MVGGGIGGLCTAVALRRVGWDVHVYERAEELRAVGGGLTLASNALRALRWLGLEEQVRALAAPLVLGAIRTVSGAPLVRAGPAMPEALGVGLHRADLQHLLVEALGPERVHLGHVCDGVVDEAAAVRATFTNGASPGAALLVAADGLRSTVRRLLHGSAEPRYAGATAWRGVAEIGPDAAGPAAAGGLHAASGVTVTSSESWGRGRRFGIVPIGAGRVYWFAVLRTPAGGRDPDGGAKPALQSLFRGWHPPIEALIAATREDAIVRHDLFDRPPLPLPWGRGRITLLGDAAHPTTPNVGQGACQAIESAVVLARHMRHAVDTAGALRAYEAERAPRVATITRLSWRLGQLAQREGRVAAALRDGLVRLMPTALQRRQLERVVGYDVTRGC